MEIVVVISMLTSSLVLASERLLPLLSDKVNDRKVRLLKAKNKQK